MGTVSGVSQWTGGPTKHGEAVSGSHVAVADAAQSRQVPVHSYSGAVVAYSRR